MFLVYRSLKFRDGIVTDFFGSVWVPKLEHFVVTYREKYFPKYFIGLFLQTCALLIVIMRNVGACFSGIFLL